MATYILVEVNITDPARYEDYKKLTPGTLAMFGGKFIVRGGPSETLEGNGQPGRIVVLEFPTTEQARAWYNSPAYTAAKQIRQEASTGRMILVEGV
jgi:uncharacterized protein (DUF1330 family)